MFFLSQKHKKHGEFEGKFFWQKRITFLPFCLNIFMKKVIKWTRENGSKNIDC